MGHLGAERVYQLARTRFYWPNMRDEIARFVTACCPCLKDKRPQYQTRSPLSSLTSSCPFELLSVDFLKLEKAGGYEYLLVIVDHFTRYAEVYPTRSKSAKAAATKLYNEFILRYGYPQRVHSDQGGEFVNAIWDELSAICDVKRTTTTPYHPQANGQCERFNRTIVQMLRTLEDDHKRSWHRYAQKLAHAYNCTTNDATGFTPFYLLFGRNPRLPIDLLFESLHPEEKKSYTTYVNEWKTAMQEAYRKAGAASSKSTSKGRAVYNSKSRSTVLSPGDRVLIRRVVDTKNHGKIKSYWEDAIGTVVRQIDDSSVYEISDPNTVRKATRMLHRNMLLPCNSLPVDAADARPQRAKQPMRGKRTECARSRATSADTDSDSSDGSESDTERHDGGDGSQARAGRVRRQPERYGSPVVYYVPLLPPPPLWVHRAPQYDNISPNHSAGVY
jgi:transposase InsO family protein